MSTKAIHLEMVSNLRTSTFLAALKRSASRSGLCGEIYSDNATTFVCLDNEFRKLIESHKHQEAVCQYATDQGIRINFISPLTPRQRGLWDAGIISLIPARYLHYQRISMIIHINSGTFPDWRPINVCTTRSDSKTSQ